MRACIFKYPLNAERLREVQVITAPAPATVIDAQFQDRTLCVWMEVMEAATLEHRRFYVAFTGDEVPPDDRYRHLRTLQHQGFVFHVYVWD